MKKLQRLAKSCINLRNTCSDKHPNNLSCARLSNVVRLKQASTSLAQALLLMLSRNTCHIAFSVQDYITQSPSLYLEFLSPSQGPVSLCYRGWPRLHIVWSFDCTFHACDQQPCLLSLSRRRVLRMTKQTVLYLMFCKRHQVLPCLRSKAP